MQNESNIRKRLDDSNTNLSFGTFIAFFIISLTMPVLLSFNVLAIFIRRRKIASEMNADVIAKYYEVGSYNAPPGGQQFNQGYDQVQYYDPNYPNNYAEAPTPVMNAGIAQGVPVGSNAEMMANRSIN
mmetsp:Transcript_18825/g.21028  ORF Transcript_18825/g.21028 Transcript_18825/m.21028 type:complete len:128 (+) Transcript_18825:333-716(+)